MFLYFSQESVDGTEKNKTPEKVGEENYLTELMAIRWCINGKTLNGESGGSNLPPPPLKVGDVVRISHLKPTAMTVLTVLLQRFSLHKENIPYRDDSPKIKNLRIF
jgi:hypothetical protein